MKEPHTVTTPIKYYSLTLFNDATRPGYQFETVWKTEKAASRNARYLFNTGNYDMIVMRLNDVERRDEHHEYSSSQPVNIWKKHGAIVPR